MEHLVKVQEHLAEIEAAGARVLAISFGAPEMVAAYRADHALPFPVASDVERNAYHALGIGRGGVQKVWRPSAIWQHIALRLRGYTSGRHRQSDVLQLGGDFVIGRDGRLLLSHPSVAGDDRVSIGEILAALKRPTAPVAEPGGARPA
jgi:AhpC/TSA antioxidant enzyme